MNDSQATNWLKNTGFNWAQLGKRGMCIAVVGALRDGQGAIGGLGGGQAAIVSYTSVVRDLPTYRQHRENFARLRTPGAREQYISQFPANERMFWRELLEGRGGSAEDATKRHAFLLMVHEIGHAFGLVPTSQEAAGIPDQAWEDTGHPKHCSERQCAMWWQTELAQVLPPLKSQEDRPFPHYNPGSSPDRCVLYLLTCDLSDLSNY
jgi:hypothetical protein